MAVSNVGDTAVGRGAQVTSQVISKDGTTIAVDRSGSGPAVVLVSGALGNRMSNAQLASHLESDFTVFNYDRRGRGESADSSAYDVAREVEDLAAVIDQAGRSVCVYGTSSGGNLVLEAARGGVQMTKLALWEPNFLVDSSRPALPDDYADHLRALIAQGQRGDAVEYFMTVAAGLPSEFVAPMREMPMWPAMQTAAHTLAYDGEVVGDSMSGKALSPKKWATVTAPTVVIDGGQTPWLTEGAKAIIEALPNARRTVLENQTHDVAAEAIAPVLAEFFGS